MTYSEKDGLPSGHVTAVFEDSRRGLWLGTTHGLGRLAGRELSVFTVPRAGGSNRITALAEDAHGQVWVGTNEGLYRFVSSRLLQVPTDGLPLLNVRILHAARDGSLWIGTQYDGVLRYRGGRFHRYTTKDGLVDDAVRAIAEQSDGTIWLGTKGGLSRFQTGRFKAFTEADGLAHMSVESLRVDRDDTLWIATRQGVNRLKQGRFVTITAADGLHASFVYCFVEDDEGNLWMNSSRGVFRVRKRDLDDFANGRARSLSSVAYGLEHGLSTTVGVISQHPVAYKARDGRVWFCTLRGACVVDPRRLATNALPPPVHVEEVVANGIARVLAPELEAEPGPGDLVFRYTGLSFTAPQKVAFRYKLEGYDRDWIDAGSRRVAYYTNIPPGEYRFHVVARNADQVWNTEGAAVKLRLAPHFHQTLAYRLAGVLALAVAAAGIHFWRLQALRRRERDLSTRVKEALAQVKILRGLLPICASCKKVRDDTGYWRQIETYIHERSEAEFSHSICPDCMGRLYPDHVARREPR